jgi:hypothetical protein
MGKGKRRLSGPRWPSEKAIRSFAASEALLPYLPAVLDGPEGWRREETVARAIEIRDGVVQNPTILSFQNREEEYPHRVRK